MGRAICLLAWSQFQMQITSCWLNGFSKMGAWGKMTDNWPKETKAGVLIKIFYWSGGGGGQKESGEMLTLTGLGIMLNGKGGENEIFRALCTAQTIMLLVLKLQKLFCVHLSRSQWCKDWKKKRRKKVALAAFCAKSDKNNSLGWMGLKLGVTATLKFMSDQMKRWKDPVFHILFSTKLPVSRGHVIQANSDAAPDSGKSQSK